MTPRYDLPIIAFLPLAGLSACATVSSPPASNAMIAQDAAAAAAFAELRERGYAGTVAVSRSGRMVFSGAAGEADAGRVFTAATKVDIASIAKPVTAMAIFKLAEQGRLSIDDRLARWFPDAPADKAGVTLRQMLDHSSGLIDIPPGMSDYRPTSADEMAARVFAAPLDFPPGTDTAYSNSGYNLLAMIVARAAGRPFFDYLQEEVLTPAGVAASYDPERFPAAQVANGIGPAYRERSVRTLAAARSGPFWGLWGAGGLFMSAEDMVRLFDAYWAGRIVRPETVRQMITPAKRSGSYADEALGWTVIHTARGEDFISYTGGSGHSSASLRHYPASGTTVATLSNRRVLGAVRASRMLAARLVGEDFEPLQVPGGGVPVAQAAPADQALLRAVLAAAAASPAERLGFVNERFTPQFRARVPAAAMAERLAQFRELERATLHSLVRTGNELSLIAETVESERPQLLRITFALTGDPAAPMIDNLRVGPVGR